MVVVWYEPKCVCFSQQTSRRWLAHSRPLQSAAATPNVRARPMERECVCETSRFTTLMEWQKYIAVCCSHWACTYVATWDARIAYFSLPALCARLCVFARQLPFAAGAGRAAAATGSPIDLCAVRANDRCLFCWDRLRASAESAYASP